MSVRAYRVKKIEYEDNPSWNLWHQPEVLDSIEYHGFIDEGGGLITVATKSLESLLKDKNVELDEDTREGITSDLKYAKKHNEEYLTYWCW